MEGSECGGGRSMARVGSKEVRAVRDDGKGEKDVMEKPTTRGRWGGFALEIGRR